MIECNIVIAMAGQFGTFLACVSPNGQPTRFLLEVIDGNLAYFTPMRPEKISAIISQLKKRATKFREASTRKLLKNFIPHKLKKTHYYYKDSFRKFVLFAGQDRV